MAASLSARPVTAALTAHLPATGARSRSPRASPLLSLSPSAIRPPAARPRHFPPHMVRIQHVVAASVSVRQGTDQAQRRDAPRGMPARVAPMPTRPAPPSPAAAGS
eukprot:scaffold2628_cov113-Isochrysis_galbana.AAC.5